MKTSMSSFDIFAIVKELQILKGARINKIYQITPSELRIQLRIKDVGRGDLVMEVGKRVHLTQYPKPGPVKPSNFAMTLRKYVGNGVINEVRQVNFDRLVEILISGKDGEDFTLIAELFGDGNAVLTHKKKIVAVMKPKRYKDRELIGKAGYEYPPQRINPFEVSPTDLEKVFRDSNMDLVRTLAMTLGLGGQYAEELCLMAGYSKNKVAITGSEVRTIHDSIKSLKKSLRTGTPVIILEDEKPVDLTPIRLLTYKEKEGKEGEGNEQKEFESFSMAADEYFTTHEIETVDKIQEERYKEKLGKFEARLKVQEDTFKKFQRTDAGSKKIGDLIYEHFGTVSSILAAITNAKKSHSWAEIIERIEMEKERGKERGKGKENGKSKEVGAITKILPKEGVIVVDLGGRDVRLDIRKSQTENADFYYSKSKKARGKIKGVRDSIEKTLAHIREIEEKGKEIAELEEKKPKKRVARKRKWFEIFRWFESSDGLLVLGGRDATTNEILVKKHMEKGDVFVHADIHGAPAVIIKAGGQDVPQMTIDEAFDFAASYSRAWRHSISALKVYWVNPEQVSKTAEHGEYVAKGAFIIRGKKNIGNGKVEVALGVTKDGQVIAGPPSAIEANSICSVRIVPGHKKSKEVAGEIKHRFLESSAPEYKEMVSGIDLQDVQIILPAGRSEII